MGRHGDGGFSIAQVTRAKAANLPPSAGAAAGGAPAGGAPGGSAPARLEGFRHFLSGSDTLPLDKQFKVDGKDPLDDLPRARGLMQRLWKRMNEEHQHPSLPVENPNIPAGYTYLLQLMAHDLVQTNFSLSVLGGAVLGVQNDRPYRLTLDTIYGGGPEVCPFAYMFDPAIKTRSRLGLGGGNATTQFPWAMQPKGRDIGRSSGDPSTADPRYGLTEVLIPDPRNDDHAIIAQLTALFHHLHNGLVDKIEQRLAGGSTQFPVKSSFERFLCARGAATLIYRNIVRRDVMEKLLHPEIYARYNVAQPPFLDRSLAGGAGNAPQAFGPPDRTAFIPLEFTHGAFRFGHSMAREKYKINQLTADEFTLEQTLLANSLWRPYEMPLAHQWTVDWSLFFSLPGKEASCQRSRRISPNYASNLNQEELFPKIDETEQTGVAYRDLMSAVCAGLWSVDGLIDEIRQRNPGLMGISPLLDDPGHRAERLRAWLQRTPGFFSDPDLETLSTNPPLPFFIQFEAATEQEGKRLGVLGSIIVAEVIFGALTGDQLPVEQGANTVKDSLSRLSQNLLDVDCFNDVPDIQSMAQLVQYTAEIAQLADARPAFL